MLLKCHAWMGKAYYNQTRRRNNPSKPLHHSYYAYMPDLSQPNKLSKELSGVCLRSSDHFHLSISFWIPLSLKKNHPTQRNKKTSMFTRFLFRASSVSREMVS